MAYGKDLRFQIMESLYCQEATRDKSFNVLLRELFTKKLLEMHTQLIFIFGYIQLSWLIRAKEYEG